MHLQRNAFSWRGTMKRKQPIFPPGKRPAPETFEILYPPTEDGHLTEEQKKWPLSRDAEPRELLPQQQSNPTTPDLQPPTN